MRCVQLAKDTGARYVYLGYRVEGCASLQYKGQFRPHELLSTRPALTDVPSWVSSG